MVRCGALWCVVVCWLRNNQYEYTRVRVKGTNTYNAALHISAQHITSSRHAPTPLSSSLLLLLSISLSLSLCVSLSPLFVSRFTTPSLVFYFPTWGWTTMFSKRAFPRTRPRKAKSRRCSSSPCTNAEDGEGYLRKGRKKEGDGLNLLRNGFIRNGFIRGELIKRVPRGVKSCPR